MKVLIEQLDFYSTFFLMLNPIRVTSFFIMIHMYCNLLLTKLFQLIARLSLYPTKALIVCGIQH